LELSASASFQIILFLVVCPFLVVFFFCWFVVKCFHNYLRDLNLKEAVAAVYAQSQQVSLLQKGRTIAKDVSNHFVMTISEISVIVVKSSDSLSLQ
jgi:hypothetical protein